MFGYFTVESTRYPLWRGWAWSHHHAMERYVRTVVMGNPALCCGLPMTVTIAWQSGPLCVAWQTELELQRTDVAPAPPTP